MPKGLLFWLLMLLWLVFGLWSRGAGPGWRGAWGHGLFLFVLLFLLGWGIFGFAIR